MEEQEVRKRRIIDGTVVDMKALGVYRAEYDPLIDIYAGMREQYEQLQEMCVGDWYFTETADGGEKKSPLAATLENLRKDILQYSDRLMLNPKARADSGAKKEERRSKLAEALGGIAG